MHLIRMNEKINRDLAHYVRNGLNLYHSQNDTFNIYIFSMFVDESMLSSHWQDIQNKVALSFQSNLEKEIELWNIYIMFFIEKEIVQKELKYKIENDHYCARKIVFDNVGNISGEEEKIKSIINIKLFNLQIPQSSNQDTIAELEDEINQIDSRLTNIQSIKTLIGSYKD